MLSPASGSLQIDATVGGGGHTERILEATNPDGRLLGLDADGAAVARVGERLARYGDRLVLRQANFRELRTVAPATGFAAVDGLLFDLGLSSYQLADTDRGFGFRAGGPLDMRFDTGRGVPGCRAAGDARHGRVDRALSSVRGGTVLATDRPGDRRRPSDRPDHDGRGARRSRRARRAAGRARTSPDPSRDARLPGAPDRGQRGARCPGGGARRGGRSPSARRPARRSELPLARGSDRQALSRRRAQGLHLPAIGAGLRLRPDAAPPTRHEAVADPDGRRSRRQSPGSQRTAAGRRTHRRVTAQVPEGGVT